MMSQPRTYTDEFKQDAVNLVVQKNYSIKQAAEALGMPAKTLQNWLKKYRTSSEGVVNVAQQNELERENRRLRIELKQAQMERDLLKKATAFFAKESQ